MNPRSMSGSKAALNTLAVILQAPGGRSMNARASHSTSSTFRQRAPYAREIEAETAAGRFPNLFCFAGSNAWERAQARRECHGLASTTLLPPGADPKSLIWPCVDAVVLVPGDCDGERLRNLILELLGAGCRCIVEIRPCLPPVAHYGQYETVTEVPV